MSFFFSWMDLKSLDIVAQVNETLSKFSPAQFPQAVALKQLILGASPPRFEVLDIIDLKEGRFKGIFKFKYDGEMNLTLNSSVEINSLRLIEFDDFTKPHFVLSDKSTTLPVDFNMTNVRIDAILTVVYNGKGITVVFNDTPIIDLDIKTSIDELLDDELFETMKRDTLEMATEFLKQDLPGLISQTQLFDDDTQKIIENNLKDDHRVSFSMDGSDVGTRHGLDHNVFNTLSLEPAGFTDVIQRISLSQYQNQKLPEKKPVGIKKRRSIKMGKKMGKKKVSIDDSMETVIHFPSTPLMKHTEMSSQASSPTLIDTTFSTQTSLEEYLLSHEPLIFNHTEVCDEGEFEDPYTNLTHPMDIVPEYEDDHKSLKQLIPETKMRPRGASSNYMKFGDFKTEFAERKAYSDVISLN